MRDDIIRLNETDEILSYEKKTMRESILSKDTEMKFPHFAVLKASAGSGKTHNLTRRFVQFLLSEKVPRSSLRNILAITFSNNAAREMKERTLSWLKKLHFGDSEKVADLMGITSLDPEAIKEKAGLLIDDILDSYSDFQIRTIDSFMTTVFKASAVDFGYNPDFEVLMSIDSLMEYSFDLFLRNAKEGTAEAAFLGEIVDILFEQKKAGESYLWDPSSALLDEIKKIYRKLSSRGKQPEIGYYSKDLKRIKEEISASVETLEKEIEGSGLKRHGNSSFRTILSLVRGKSFSDIIGKGFTNPPVCKPPKGNMADQSAYDRIGALWGTVEVLIRQFTVIFVRSRCAPYVKAYQSFSKTLETAKRQQGKVFIEDINMHLAGYLDSAIVPDVYFRIGETIFHFLIDEFQDTSPIQWQNLFPLIENSLSQGGSLFTVGDTKQAIYGFRNADYAIMKGFERDNPFPSAEHSVRELPTNYRSKKRIIAFNEKVFKKNLIRNDEYREAGKRSGLTEYVQNPREGDKEDGSVAISLLERNDDEPPERLKIQELVEELRKRGYDYRDIAVLTQTNEDAVSATTWLNEKEVPFISYSSLDVRRRTITGEIVALMNFLDAPTDDLSFGTFILGDVFTKAVSHEHSGIDGARLREFCFAHRDNPPLYKAFQETFTSLWERYFDGLFRAVGFLPVYDLVTEIFAVFRVFDTIAEEEAALVKILEVVKDFEGGGFNSIKDFLSTALDDDSGEKWEMAVPTNTNAVQVMTIHKAKGLGFPVVIVLLYEVKNRGFEYIIEETGNTVCLLKINKAAAACDEGLQDLYDQERMKEMVNRLNSLYVGFTRPERELYVVGVKTRDTAYPFVLFPTDEFLPSAAGQAAVEKKSIASVALPSCPLLHRNRQFEFPDSAEEFMTIEEKRRGDFIHRVLFYLDYVTDGTKTGTKEIIRRAREDTGYDYPGEETEALVIAVTEHCELAEYFRAAPDRETRKEQEYSDSAGRLFRMDRVIIDPGAITVIDYKTGGNKEALEKYRAQMRNYMGILGEVYPGKSISGIIAFVDLGEVVRVR
jgi:ATP-dependent helicase/nuclease subunit A